jgi:hypothetical protein
MHDQALYECVSDGLYMVCALVSFECQTISEQWNQIQDDCTVPLTYPFMMHTYILKYVCHVCAICMYVYCVCIYE